MCGLLAYQGYTISINGVAAPWIATSFQLSQSGIATLYACISVSALGALILARLADRIGRRRVLLGCLAATPVCALGAALSFDLPLFALSEILLNACIGATMSSATVMLAEELPIAQRAAGQSYGGLAMGFGSGWCVIVMPLLADAGYSWRWVFAVTVIGGLAIPLLARVMPESRRWQHAEANGVIDGVRFSDVLNVRYRSRAIPMLICAFLGTIAGAAASNWPYFHAVSIVRLSPDVASTMVIVGGGIGMIGFPLGAWLCERFGRVPTVASAGPMLAAGTLWFYWGPPAALAWHAGWLAIGYCAFSIAVNAATVGANSAATELFPTALRNTMVGWFALTSAIASVIAQAAIALLSGPLGGLSTVVGYLGLLAIPNAIIFGVFVDETRGLPLEVAARERGPISAPDGRNRDSC
ncbi:MAG TPA: MFS transporter [Candidatus Kryptonia bacterium]|nr:MFS transporter [Candidatus Kryptonia bacterium]